MKNEYKITKKEMMSWAKEYYLNGAANIVLFILWCVVGFCGLSMLVALSRTGGELLDWFGAILFLSLAVFKLFFARFVVASKRYKVLSQTYGVTEWIRSAEFVDEEIILCDHTSVTKLKYENIRKIKEKGNVVMVFFNHNVALRLYKDAFVEGSWEECKEKISAFLK